MSGTFRKGLVRQDGAWTPINNLFVRQGGSWVRAENAYVRQGGAWHHFYRHRFIYNLSLNSLSVQQLNLRSYALAAGWNGIHPITINFTVTGTGWLQAPSKDNYALVVDGVWPAGSSVTINLEPGGVIAGCGGTGGLGGRGWTWFTWYSSGFPVYNFNYPDSRASWGFNGGPAIYINGIVTSINNLGTITGGGGGGAGGWAMANQDGFDFEMWPNSVDGGGGGGGGRPFGLGAAGGAGTNWYSQFASGTGANGPGGTNADMFNPGVGGTVPTSPGLGGFWIVGRGGNGGEMGQAGESFNIERWEYTSNAYKNGGPRTQYSAYLGFTELIKGGDPGFYITGVNWVNWLYSGDLRGWSNTT